MATDNPQRSVLLIGKSQLVLDGALAGLRDLGYKAEATNDFADVTARFDTRDIDLVVFGGQLGQDLRAELREEISAINPRRASTMRPAPARPMSSWKPTSC
jgi:vacuolar-type H+-ATPase subunit F/Vma7